MTVRARFGGMPGAGCLCLAALAGCREPQHGATPVGDSIRSATITTAAAPAREGPPTVVIAPDTTRVQEPCTGPEWLECAKEEERHAITRAGGRVHRVDTVLSLVSGDGRELTFADAPTNDVDHVQHRYLGPVPGLPIDVIAVDYFEGGEYIAVHVPTGDTARIDALPLVAPNGEWVLTASVDLDVGYFPNRLTVYRVSPGGLDLAWREETGRYGEPGSWGAVDSHWLDSATVAFARVHEHPDGPVRRGEGRLEYRDGEWRLLLAPDP